jgi:hypothetical protein
MGKNPQFVNQKLEIIILQNQIVTGLASCQAMVNDQSNTQLSAADTLLSNPPYESKEKSLTKALDKPLLTMKPVGQLPLENATYWLTYLSHNETINVTDSRP